MNSFGQITQRIQQQVQSQRVATIFDLDSTLFSVGPRTQHILRQLADEPGFSARFQAAAQILRTIEVRPADYSVKQVLARTELQPTPELVEAVRGYWRTHFFSNDHLDKDELYPSANEYLNHLKDLGAQVLYLTGREDALMRAGTIRALRHWRFPDFADSDLMMKSSHLESDEHFKVVKLKELVHHYDSIWFFENEPLIIHDVRKALPQIQIVFVNSIHSGKAQAPEGLPTIIPDYRWRSGL